MWRCKTHMHAHTQSHTHTHTHARTHARTHAHRMNELAQAALDAQLRARGSKGSNVGLRDVEALKKGNYVQWLDVISKEDYMVCRMLGFEGRWNFPPPSGGGVCVVVCVCALCMRVLLRRLGRRAPASCGWT